MTHVSCADLRQNLSRYLDETVATRASIVVTRQGSRDDVVMMSEAKFLGWQETVHLLSSPPQRRATAARCRPGGARQDAGACAR